MIPVLIAHLLLPYKKAFPARFSNHTHEKNSVLLLLRLHHPSSDFLGTKERKAHWTSSSKEKETKATGDLGNSFLFPLSSLSPSITYPNKDTQLKPLDPWHRSIHTQPQSQPEGAPLSQSPEAQLGSQGLCPAPRTAQHLPGSAQAEVSHVPYPVRVEAKARAAEFIIWGYFSSA